MYSLLSHKNIQLTTCLIVTLLISQAAIAIPYSALDERTNNAIKNSQQASSLVEYEILFNEFSNEQVLQIQLFMLQYSGYVSHRLEMQNSSNFHLLYISSIKKDMLINNLEKTAQYLGFDVLIRSAGEQVNMRLIKVMPNNLPYKEW